MEKLTLSASEAAQVIGVSRATVSEMRRVKGVPTVQLGKRIVVSGKGLERWMEPAGFIKPPVSRSRPMG